MVRSLLLSLILICSVSLFNIHDAEAFSWCFGNDPASDYAASYKDTDGMFYMPVKLFLGSNETLAGGGMDIDYYGTDPDLWGFGFNLGQYIGFTNGAYELPDMMSIYGWQGGPLPVGHFAPNLSISYGDVTVCNLGVYIVDDSGNRSFREFSPENDFRITINGESVVPEPATMTLLGIGSVVMAFARRKKQV